MNVFCRDLKGRNQLKNEERVAAYKTKQLLQEKRRRKEDKTNPRIAGVADFIGLSMSIWIIIIGMSLLYMRLPIGAWISGAGIVLMIAFGFGLMRHEEGQDFE